MGENAILKYYSNASDNARDQAKMYLASITATLTGGSFGYTINNSAFDYFLGRITTDYGAIPLARALVVFDEHAGKHANPLHNLRRTADKYRLILFDLLK